MDLNKVFQEATKEIQEFAKQFAATQAELTAARRRSNQLWQEQQQDLAALRQAYRAFTATTSTHGTEDSIEADQQRALQLILERLNYYDHC